MNHDDMVCGIAWYAWNLCEGCVEEGEEIVLARYGAGTMAMPVLVEPTPAGIAKAVEEDSELPF